MEVEAAKVIGAGIATLALGAVGLALGNIFSSFLGNALRNPTAAPKLNGTLLLAFALTEATGLFALVVALLILFL